MKTSAHVQSHAGEYRVSLMTDERVQSIAIPSKANGQGSAANGGELLSLALASCYCNDIYREAGKRGIKVDHVEVEVESEFGAEGAAARSVAYRARVVAQATEDEIRDLLKHTDTVAEIQNTLRAGYPVSLKSVEVVGDR